MISVFRSQSSCRLSMFTATGILFQDVLNMSGIIPEIIWLHGIPNHQNLMKEATIVIETKDGTEILVRQIAGAVARRIVTYAKENQEVMQGDELGFIKFGSRVDVFLPVGTEIEVPILQQVKANKSIIAKI